MKIQSSDLFFQSSSTTTRTLDDTLYDFNENGQLVDKRQTYRTEQETLTERALFQTGPAYVVATRHVQETSQIEQEDKTNEASAAKADDLEKRIYLKSVLDWSADAIDFLITKFEENQLQSQDQRSRDSGFFRTVFQGGQTQDAKGVSFYRAMAEEYRERAAALVPEMLIGELGSSIQQTLETEQQTILVQAGGQIHTADGREINFSLDLSLNREKTSETVSAFKVVDPLVINFKGTSAELGDNTVSFDLDADGSVEEIAGLGAGSAFLALDINGDGLVNNGTELFGPSTGDGFQELSFYDKDNNGWIDESDPVFEQLVLWAGQGDLTLDRLADAGIGAIHIGNVKSNFLMENASGESVARLSGTGVAITESGEIKTIQQVDLIV